MDDPIIKNIILWTIPHHYNRLRFNVKNQSNTTPPRSHCSPSIIQFIHTIMFLKIFENFPQIFTFCGFKYLFAKFIAFLPCGFCKIVLIISVEIKTWFARLIFCLKVGDLFEHLVAVCTFWVMGNFCLIFNSPS
jgi:hypothetical protein